MMSKIFRKPNGEYTLNEFDSDIQNTSVIPNKYSKQDPNFEQRIEILKEELSK